MIDDVERVERANADFYTAFESGDLDRMAAVWAQDSDAGGEVVCTHPGGPLLRGRGTVLRSWALLMANISYIQFVLTDVETRVFGETAVLTCAENILTADDDESGAFVAGGRVVATNAYVRTPDGWRLWLHHGSPVMTVEGDEPEEPM